MEKIKLITDSTSDIPLPVAEELGIDVLSIMLSVNGGSYAEQRDLSTDEFYDLLVQSDELPTTSQITSFTYEEKFKEYLDAGYTDVICVTINSKGSATHQNAQMAKAALYDNYPMAQEQMRIHIIDSKIVLQLFLQLLCFYCKRCFLFYIDTSYVAHVILQKMIFVTAINIHHNLFFNNSTKH